MKPQTKIKIITVNTGLKIMHLTSAYGTFIRVINSYGDPFNKPLNK